MPYLRRLSAFLLAIFLKIDWVPSVVALNEQTTRYIFDENYFNEFKRVVKYAAFMPSKKTGDISIYRISKCREWKIWAIGKCFVERLRPDNVVLRARANLPARHFVGQRLTVIPKRRPHARHAVVTGWPEEKAAQRVKAIELAQDAILVVRPRPAKSNES